MEEQQMEVTSSSVLIMLAGIWLIISPYIMNYTSTAAKWNQVVLGIGLFIVSAIRAFASSQRWMSWLIGLAAIWGVISPFILGYDRTSAYWNGVITAGIVVLLSLWNGAYGTNDMTRSDTGRHAHQS